MLDPLLVVVGLNVRVPLKSATAIRLVELIRCGRSNAVCSICMPTGRRPDRMVARNRVPAPMGTAVTFSATSMLRL
jgi:hypothetical protein